VSFSFSLKRKNTDLHRVLENRLLRVIFRL